MSVWAHACRPCSAELPGPIFVSAAAVAEMPASTHYLQVRIDDHWHCVVVDRDRRVAVEQMLIRDAVVASRSDCPDCAAVLDGAATSEPPTETKPASPDSPPMEPPPTIESSTGDDSSAGTVQAAAMSVRGQHVVVVLVPLDLVTHAGEAEMAVERLAATFAGAPVVLMGQQDDGTARYFGAEELTSLVGAIPLERMPWKVYRLR